MRISLNWLREFVDLPEFADELRVVLDDLGLVVEGVEVVGEGLEQVVVARVDEIRAIEGADRIRLVVVDAGSGPLEIVCGASNMQVGDHVPLAPVGAVLPGGFVIARRQMRGVTSNGMLCSGRELRLSDDHEGLMILSDLVEPRVGQPLLDALALEPDVIFDITVEGNRPDAWCVAGVARDLAARLDRPLRAPAIATPDHGEETASHAAATLDAPDLCARLTVSVLTNVAVAPSPSWVAQRLRTAGMRPINNVVDASNLVMLELGQPTHPYDAQRVAGRAIGVRRARAGEAIETLDGVTRALATPGRGLGDTGEDCVIVDGEDRVVGLAGIMGGASSEISPVTSEVLVEAACFDAMAIARSSKRHGLRTEASNRFERGVDPTLALRAVGRLVEVLRQSSPGVLWLDQPLDVFGEAAPTHTVQVRPGDLRRALGVELDRDVVVQSLNALGFRVEGDDVLNVTAPPSRPDVRAGAAGRADVIEEVARIYGYGRLPRHTPTWPEPGGTTPRQRLRRRVRDTLVDVGVYEAWTPTLGSDEDFDLLHPGVDRVRITNPLAAEESVLRATMVTGLVRAWGRNVERGTGDVLLGELGVVFSHPQTSSEPRRTRGGAGGTVELELPNENERVTVLLGRADDDAASAVALWSVLAGRLGVGPVVVRSGDAPAGQHPTRSAALVVRSSGVTVGHVGEVDPDLVAALVPSQAGRHVGVLDVDLDVLDALVSDEGPVRASVPSRYPSAVVDLAFVTPAQVHADDLAEVMRVAGDLVESVALFDVFRSAQLPVGTRSLAYRVRFSSPDGTLSESDVAAARQRLIDAAAALGAALR